jgi:hypothetical protein
MRKKSTYMPVNEAWAQRRVCSLCAASVPGKLKLGAAKECGGGGCFYWRNKVLERKTPI